MRVRCLLPALCATLLVASAGPPQAGAEAQPPRLDARSWALIDARSGDVLASHAAARRLPIASATKLMTAYVALRELPLSRRVEAAPYAPLLAESLLGLAPGERVSVRDLLYGLILRSGNDAARDLALAAAGSEARFVRRMNRYAAALGLADTRFSNPIGLDAPGNRSSARDLAALGRRLMEIPVFARIATSRRAVLRSLRPPRRIVTRNELLFRLPWANGIKTGHTLGAGYVLVGAGRLDGVQLVSAVLGAPSERARDDETARLLGYGFSLYRKRLPIRRGEALAGPEIRYAGGQLALRAARGVALGLRRGQRLDVDVRAPRRVEGPIPRGAVLGQAIVSVDGRRVAAVPLRAARQVPEASALQRLRSRAAEGAGLLALAVFAILVGAVLLRRNRRRGKRRRAR